MRLIDGRGTVTPGGQSVFDAVALAFVFTAVLLDADVPLLDVTNAMADATLAALANRESGQATHSTFVKLPSPRGTGMARARPTVPDGQPSHASPPAVEL
jgi:hypothetical protein